MCNMRETWSNERKKWGNHEANAQGLTFQDDETLEKESPNC